MKANKGFTLIEVAVVLAIIAILAAMLTPIVTSYIDQARATRANNDVKKIAEAVNLFKRDTGVYPGYDLLADARTGANAKTCLFSGTSTPNTTSTYFTAGSAWTCTTYGQLNFYLNVATATANSIGTAALTGGGVQFRGPYLDGLNGSDPWGNPYVVNSAYLTDTASSWAFAISGGPNGQLDTTQTQAKTTALAVGPDDIVSQIK